MSWIDSLRCEDMDSFCPHCENTARWMIERYPEHTGDHCPCFYAPQEARHLWETSFERRPRGLRSALIDHSKQVGIELEFSGAPYYDSLAHHDDSLFGCDLDGTAGVFVEFVTPPLKGAEIPSQLQLIGDRARRDDWRVDESCGVHVHVDATEYSDDQLMAIANAWSAVERYVLDMVPCHRRTNYFCRPVDFYTDRAGRHVSELRTFDDFMDLVYSRYAAMNPSSYAKHRTIEFRAMEGTTDMVDVLNWSNMLGQFVERAASTSRFVWTGGRLSRSNWNGLRRQWFSAGTIEWMDKRTERFAI